MEGLNITAIILYITGSIIISVSNVWLITSNSSENHVKIASSNLVSIFSMGIGGILNYIYTKNKIKDNSNSSIEMI